MAQDGFKRKLTAILSADAKGYSHLMGEDEETTVRTLTTYREVICTLVIDHNGRVIDSPGDNILAEFTSIVDAMRCAWDVQQEIKSRNNELPEKVRMNFRIGINLGDVIEEGDRIYGDGVNIAARLEGLAEGGGICISGTAYDQVKNKLPFRYEYEGEQTVKNIKEPVRVYRVLTAPEKAVKPLNKKKRTPAKKWLWAVASTIFILLIIVVGLYWKYFYLPTPTNIDPDNKMSFNLPKGPSIVVLPFVNMSGDPKQEFFCDGITEIITSALAHVPKLFVIARNSAFSYKGKSLKVQQIGHELGVDYVIEGSIQKSEDTIRVTVQLVKTSSGNHIWSEIYNRKLIDIFKLQDEITIEILKAIGINLTSGEGYRGAYDRITDLNTFIKIQKMWHYYWQMNKESNSLARKFALEVIAADSQLSIVYFALGYTYIMDILFGACKSPIICLGQATEAGRKALSLDPNSDRPHELVGYIFLLRKEHEKAIDELKRAIVINPNNADAYNDLGTVYYFSDRPYEGIDYLNKAIKLNPLPPTIYFANLGFAYSFHEDYEKALEALKKAVEIEPNNIFAHIGLAVTYALIGNEEKAKIEAKEVLNINPNYSIEVFTKTMPFKNPLTINWLAEYLRKAGLK
jgi:adenylate cyclase